MAIESSAMTFGNHAAPMTMPVVVILVFLAAAASAQTTANAVIRVPVEAGITVEQLGLHPIHELDYGSFRWLELDASELNHLHAAGQSFEIVKNAGRVRVMGFDFDPLADGEPEPPAGLRAREGNTAGLRLIQLIGPAKAEWIGRLAEAGPRFLQYYPHNTFLVWANTAQCSKARSLGFVRWVGDFHPFYKLEPGLADRGIEIRNVDIMLFNDGSPQKSLGALADRGATIIQHYPSQPDGVFFDVIATVPAGSLEDIALLEQVVWIGYQSTEPGLDDEMSDQIVAGNHFGGVPEVGYNLHLMQLGYDGENVIWATIDTGVDYDHPDFQGRIVGGYSFPGACTTNPGDDCGGGHGTHVTGIIGGDAAAAYADEDGFLYGLGVAPAYGIFAMNPVMGTSWPPSGGWEENSKRAILGGAIGGNNSWWTLEANLGYHSAERMHDFMVRDGNFDTAAVAEPFIEVFSAGNLGPSAGTLSAPKEAKNLIVVASSMNYRAGGIDSISSFSSRGPAHDGRWVPTVAAPGEVIASARNDSGGDCTGGSSDINGTNATYSLCSGTSMAAPHASGAVILVSQWWRTFNSGADPSPAMAKALLVNGAVDMAAPDIPNISEGWGRINITNVIEPGVEMVYKDQLTTFDNAGDEWTMSVNIPEPTLPLKLSLAWSDAPGAVGADPALVNNLDLEVETDGATYVGNDFAAGWSTTGGSADTLNNLENVFVAIPGNGAVITIRATNVPGDGVPYSGDTTDQDFALVCFNCVEQADFNLSLTPASLDVCAPNDAIYTVDIGSTLGYSEPVTLTTSGVPAGATVSIHPNPVVPGGSATLVIGNTSAVLPGGFTIEITGTAPDRAHSKTVDLNLFDTLPVAPVLIAPVDGAADQPARPEFGWTAVNQAATYTLQVATDPEFLNLVVDRQGITGVSFVPDFDLPTNSRLHWRVRAENGCGISIWSGIYEFTTEPMVGDCSIEYETVLHLSDDFEGGDGSGWLHGGSSDTWALSGSRVHSGVWSFGADGVATVSDQWLESADVILPTGQAPLTLQFWNWQELEDRDSGCYDGSILEISTDGGTNWTQLLDADLITDPYDGPVANASQNPLADLDAWCGDPQDWLESVVELDEYAGQTVRFRFRLGTDLSVGREGWYIDDVVVQGSRAPATPAGSLQFSAAGYSVAENGTSATITVTRADGSVGEASVDYATADGSATAGSDYTASNGTLNWVDGDATSKTFVVLITDDSNYEGDETVNLSLTNAAGANLGAPSSAEMTITEDDPVPPDPLFSDGFESGDTSNWSQIFGGG